VSDWSLDDDALAAGWAAANERGLTGRTPWLVTPNGRVVFGDDAMLHDDLLDQHGLTMPGRDEDSALATGVVFRGKATQYYPVGDDEWEEPAQEAWDELDEGQGWKGASAATMRTGGEDAKEGEGEEAGADPEAGAEAAEGAGGLAEDGPLGQPVAWWPEWEDVDAISRDVVHPHQGYRDPGLIVGAVGNARMAQAYGLHGDIYDTAADLINKLQRQQAVVEGNKRTAVATGLHFLMNNGVDVAGVQGALPAVEDAVWALSYEGDDAVRRLADVLRQATAGRTSSAYYHSPSAFPLNDALRNGRPLDEEQGAASSELDASMRPLPEPTVLYRGLVDRDMLQPGGYISTSRDPDVAEDFAFGIAGPDDDPVILRISVPAGAGATEIPAGDYGDQKEVLLDRTGTLRVTGDSGERTVEGTPILDAEYVVGRTAASDLMAESIDSWAGPAMTNLNQGVSMEPDQDGASRGDASNWAYLNGHVRFGGPHWDLMEQLARDLGYGEEEARRLGNLLARGRMPDDRDAAFGATVVRRDKTYPQIWMSNADRNAVWDAVAGTLSKTAGRTGQDELKWLYERRNGKWHWFDATRRPDPAGGKAYMPSHTQLAQEKGIIADDDHVDWGRFVPGYALISHYDGVPVPAVRAYGYTPQEEAEYSQLAMDQLAQMYPGLQTKDFTAPPRKDDWSLTAGTALSGHQGPPLGQRAGTWVPGSPARGERRAADSWALDPGDGFEDYWTKGDPRLEGGGTYHQRGLNAADEQHARVPWIVTVEGEPILGEPGGHHVDIPFDWEKLEGGGDEDWIERGGDWLRTNVRSMGVIDASGRAVMYDLKQALPGDREMAQQAYDWDRQQG